MSQHQRKKTPNGLTGWRYGIDLDCQSNRLLIWIWIYDGYIDFLDPIPSSFPLAFLLR